MSAGTEKKIDWSRIFLLCLGLGLFLVIYFMPPWKDASDPTGKTFQLTREGKAAIAISLPVSLVIAKYLGVAPEVILYPSLVTAGMPFVLLIGAAPNAIAYESRQFTTGDFFKHGLVMSVVLLLVLGVFLITLWPMLGMPITLK
jgi:hypothetical protein